MVLVDKVVFPRITQYPVYKKLEFRGINSSFRASSPRMKTLLYPSVLAGTFGAIVAPLAAQSPLVATYLPHGPADPPNPAWAPTAYRDIPWWFEDTNPYWADNNLPNGAADAYDVSALFAARLNRNNASGYEAAIINLPGATGSYYGAPGGAFGSPANSIVWGNSTTWSFSMVYDWLGGSPVATMMFANGTTVHTASANLGSRMIDFVNGTGPFLEPHNLGDLMFRFATIGTYGTTPAFTHASLTVSDMALSINSGPPKSIVYFSDGVEKTSIKTSWDHVPGGTSETNPRKVEFLVMNDVIPGHENRVEVTGNLTFAWLGNVNSISSSGVMFEMKMGDLDFFPPAEEFSQVPEPTLSVLIGLGGILFVLRRCR